MCSGHVEIHVGDSFPVVFCQSGHGHEHLFCLSKAAVCVFNL